MKLRRFLPFASAGLLLSGICLYGQATAGFQGEVLAEVNALEKKIVGLAEATPEDKYSWRPGTGVRSVSEVFVHIANANFNIPRSLGVQPPDGLPKDAEKTVTGKAQVVALLKQSFEHLRGAGKTHASEPEKLVTRGKREVSTRSVFVGASGHMHEHLGQLIAYSRVNGVKPPWAAER
ncbi:MAG: DinB family protein [Bryobacteraceae bacterium]